MESYNLFTEQQNRNLNKVLEVILCMPEDQFMAMEWADKQEEQVRDVEIPENFEEETDFLWEVIKKETINVKNRSSEQKKLF